MRILVAAIVGVALAAAALPARAELMLLDPPRTDYRWYGVLFVGLSLASAAGAAHDFQEADVRMKKAREAYDLYKAAATADDATKYRKLTNRYHREGRAFESTGNAASFMAVVLGVSSIYCFMTPDKKDGPILLSADRVTFQLHF